MITLKDLVKRKINATPLERAVIDSLIRRYQDFDDITDYIKDILYHGCKSGVVDELIYYHDTLAFYEEHKQEINTLVYELMHETGIYNLKELFGFKEPTWDIEDPLTIETTNRNLLAWFGYEQCLMKLAYEWRIEL